MKKEVTVVDTSVVYDCDRGLVRMQLAVARDVPNGILEKVRLGEVGAEAITPLLSVSMRRDFELMIRKDPTFLDWVIDDGEGWRLDLKANRRKATRAITNVLDLEDMGDPKLMTLKMNAAKLVLEMQEAAPKSSASSNPLADQLAKLMMPKKYKGASIEDMQHELGQIEAAAKKEAEEQEPEETVLD